MSAGMGRGKRTARGSAGGCHRANGSPLSPHPFEPDRNRGEVYIAFYPTHAILPALLSFLGLGQRQRRRRATSISRARYSCEGLQVVERTIL